MDYDHLCMGCMQDKGALRVCPHCDYDEAHSVSPVALPLRVELNQQYIIGRVLGVPGGFGITYLAWDKSLATPVAIKEYKPRGLVERSPDRQTILPQSQEDEKLFRDGLSQFLNEAQLLAQLAQLNHPNIVRVRSFFEANDTGYMVMDYYRGIDLPELLKQHGTLAPKTALWIMMPILDGLYEVHQRKVLHRDIKPANIYITERKQPVLLDFGAARTVLQGQSQGLTAVRTPGFAPYEQEVSGKQGPWTDIYACGATLYYLLSGQVPQPALERKLQDKLVPLEQLSAAVPHGLSDAVMQALAVDWEHRPQDVRTFQTLLSRDDQLPNTAATLPPTAASLIVTCPQCQVTNSVPAGSSPTEMQCAQCSAPLSPPTAPHVALSTGSPPSLPSVAAGLTAILTGTGQGKSLAAIAAVLVLFLGAGVWAKGYYDRVAAEAAAEKEAQRRDAVLEKKRREAEAKRLEQVRLELEQQQRQIEAEKQKIAAQEAEQRKLAAQEELAAREAARREAERERQREARARQRAAERRRTEERFVQKEYRPTPPPLPANNPDPLDSINKATDVACKLLGTCDSRFR